MVPAARLRPNTFWQESVSSCPARPHSGPTCIGGCLPPPGRPCSSGTGLTEDAHERVQSLRGRADDREPSGFPSRSRCGDVLADDDEILVRGAQRVSAGTGNDPRPTEASFIPIGKAVGPGSVPGT